ncbi:MAG: hypothetical protein QOJ94_2945 [Sphingomonadales bacterium]|jgi:hypothetical protein|nr:hypothetical protein [Sphingomonadales bacterium]
MRAALLLLTALAVATPAVARLQPAPAGPVVAPPEAPRPGRGGVWTGPGRHRHHRGAQGGYVGYGGYGGYAFADYADEGPGGFFEEGEAVPAPGGVRYLYDRSYPYDYYRPVRPRGAAWREPEAQGCSVRSEGPVAVHSCRR